MSFENGFLSVSYIVLVFLQVPIHFEPNLHRKLISVFSVSLVSQTISLILTTVYQVLNDSNKTLALNATQLAINNATNQIPSSQLNGPAATTTSIGRYSASLSTNKIILETTNPLNLTTNSPSNNTIHQTLPNSITENLSDVSTSILQSSNLNITITLAYDTLEKIWFSAQVIHILSINLFILFLLIIAKGWPITRSRMPFKYAFFIFWTTCLCFDLLHFYWTKRPNITELTSIILPNSISLDVIPIRLSLGLRVVIMIFFLLELRATVILEQDEKKLKFYLSFGAATMVWFISSVIVYLISLRVQRDWQTQLINGFSAAADFIAFLLTTTILLNPNSSRSKLFKKRSLPNVSHETANNNINHEVISLQQIHHASHNQPQIDGDVNMDNNSERYNNIQDNVDNCGESEETRKLKADDNPC